jgi:integrase
MTDSSNITPVVCKHVPWNRGKTVGAKPPFRPKHVWSIRTKLQVEGRVRDLALFNLAIDSKLRGCDVMALKVDDIAPAGYAVDRATVRQRKTGRPVKFELSEDTRQAVDEHLRISGKRSGDYVFTGRRGPGRKLTTRQYARLLYLDCWHRFRPTPVWDTFPPAHESDPDLSTHGQLESGPAFVGAYQDREHRQIPWD